MSGKYRFVMAPEMTIEEACAKCCVEKGSGACWSIACDGGYLATVTKPTVVRGRVRATVLRAADGHFVAGSKADPAADLARLHDIASRHGGYVQFERLIEGEPGRILL